MHGTEPYRVSLYEEYLHVIRSTKFGFNQLSLTSLLPFFACRRCCCFAFFVEQFVVGAQGMLDTETRIKDMLSFIHDINVRQTLLQRLTTGNGAKLTGKRI